MTSKERPPLHMPKDRVCKVFALSEVIGGVIQLIGVVAALIFGVWAIKSYDVGQRANRISERGLRQSIIANQLAFLSLCASSETISNSSACISALRGVSLSSIAVELDLPSASTTSLPPTTTRSIPTSITTSSIPTLITTYTTSTPFTTLTATTLLTTTQTFPTATTFVTTDAFFSTTFTTTSSFTVFSSATLTTIAPTTLFTTTVVTATILPNVPSVSPSSVAPSAAPMEPSDSSGSGGGGSKALSLNAIIGLVVGIPSALAAILALYVGCRRRRAWGL